MPNPSSRPSAPVAARSIPLPYRPIVAAVLAAVTLVAVVLFAVSGPVAAQDGAGTESLPDPGILRFEIRPVSDDLAIEVDARLDEPAWDEALVVPLPYEWFPGDNVTPPVATECLVTYDDENLYVAFRALDPEPQRIRANLMDRDNVRNFVQDDHVGFQVDPFNDERRAFQFRINPLGVQVDAIFSEIDQLEDFSYDAIWESAGRLTPEGYVVEVALPLTQIRFPRTLDIQTWGFEAFRSWPRSARHRISSKYTDRDKDCTLCQENKIEGFQNIEPGLDLEIDPTLTVIRTDRQEEFPAGPLVSGDEDIEPGVFARWGVTPNVNVTATLNPDFSQVEADVAQLEINTRFALQFPERRPFFLEGQDFYGTPLEAVFTRTVADPEWGAKVTGKEGKNAIGAYVARDRQTNLLIPGNQGSRRVFLDDESTNSVLRYRRDVGERSTLGLLVTDRSSSDYSNTVYGVDGFLRLDNSNAVRFQALQSDTTYPGMVGGRPSGLENVSGLGWLAQYDHLSRNWIATLSHTDLDEGFRADAGFIPRVDVKTSEGRVLRRLWGGQDTWYNQLIFGVTGLYTEDQSGQKTDSEIEAIVNYQGPYQSVVEVTVSDAEQRFAGRLFSTDRQGVFASIKPSGDVNITFETIVGDAVDFNGARQADLFQIQPGLELRLGRHVNLRLDHVRQTLDIAQGELFTVDLSQLRFVYQFNVRAFIRAIIQYQTIDFDPALFGIPEDIDTEDLFSQLLFSYEINPQTVFFLGYTDTRAGVGAIDLTQTQRTYFMKVGYAFLF